MPQLSPHPRENYLHVEITHALTEEAIEELRKAIDGYINEYDQVPNLVIEAKTLPGWKSFAALRKHFDLVKDHHRLIERIAVVSDSASLSVLPELADHFIAANLRHFKAAHVDAAIEWVTSSLNTPDAFKFLDGFPPDVIAVELTGTVTSADYDKVLRPKVENKLEVHKQIKLFCKAGEAFDGYSTGAMWDDLRLGLSHWFEFSKIAIVTDIGWIRHGAKLFGPLMPAQVMIFDADQAEDARVWIAQ